MFTQIQTPTRLQFLPPPLPASRRRPNFSGTNVLTCLFAARVFNCLNATAYDKNTNPSQESEEFTGSVEEEVRRAYPFHEIEPKWQRYWEDNKTFRTPDDIDTSKPKFYVLDMFPYPSNMIMNVSEEVLYWNISGAGLHVGHPLGYTATDILARLKRMQGFNVLHPMGWDAFGLPAEQYAIELKLLGFSYDWDREISTTEPEYYKWTQWIFLQLLKRGLAYQAEVPVNWCPALGTVLANEEVVDDLNDLDWPESVKEMQRNWIGRWKNTKNLPLERVILRGLSSRRKKLASSLAVMQEIQLMGQLPIWVADYVLGSYGTGAIMAVPAHDTRDHEFALKYNLPICGVVTPDNGSFSYFEKAYAGEGTMINSSSPASGLDINGLSSKDAASTVIKWLQKTGNGMKKVNYKLRDWLFARQRYWGEPIPVIFLDDTVKTVDPTSGRSAQRETNTMPQWAGSCWCGLFLFLLLSRYYLRFMDPRNSEALVDKEKEMYWSPVDVYVGGAEHAVLHLLYARFWHKVLYDVGIVSTKEPFQCVINQGIILGEVQYTALRDSDGNLVSADSVDEMGSFSQESVPEDKACYFAITSDSLRLYEMFMGPFRVWRLVVGSPSVDGKFKDGTVRSHGNLLWNSFVVFIDALIRNTIQHRISAMMEFTNAAYKWDKLPRLIIEDFVLLLSPYAPHMAEELWSRLGHSNSLAYEPFPKVNPAYLKESTVVLPVQINGKTRGTIQVEKTCTEEDAFKLASLDSKLSKFLTGKTIKKRIFVPGKILNVILDAQSAKVGQR
ncbi:UNVERIFIED_CONTAM: Leucine--tRNA ligase, chloroplastic/mitochondrial [Sesamum radiatum]|uniref:leucine--tRNA ligase n=1 Tax=Sesamum radiatum TaxID=300843 RepID=A0AAW2KJJ3_SESRA